MVNTRPVQVVDGAKSCSYIVYEQDSEYHVVNGLTGKKELVDDDGTDALDYAIAELPTNGGLIKCHGKIVLSSAVAIDRNSVQIEGLTDTGDLYFTEHSGVAGFFNKWGTSFVADGFDAFTVGDTTMAFGVAFKNFGIYGKTADAIGGAYDTTYSAGAGIRVDKANSIKISGVGVERKQYGIRLHTGSYSLDPLNVEDVIFLDRIYFVRNVYGLYCGDWTANVRVNNIYGYINQKSLIYAPYARYDWRINNLFSNADAFNASAYDQTPVYIGTQRDLHINGASIYGAYGAALCPVPLMHFVLNRYYDGEEAHRAYVYLNDVVLLETDEEAIRLSGAYGILDIHNIYAGSTGNQGFAGGAGEITKQIVNNVGTPETEFYIDGGFAKSEYASKSDWFVGAMRIENLANYPTKNGGIKTVSGNGSDGDIVIPHGLVKTPTKYNAIAVSSDARTAQIAGALADATNLTIYFYNALGSGTNNISVSWTAEVEK